MSRISTDEVARALAHIALTDEEIRVSAVT